MAPSYAGSRYLTYAILFALFIHLHFTRADANAESDPEPEQCGTTSCTALDNSTAAPAARPIQIALHASWAATTPHAETAVWLAMTSGVDSAWAFLDVLGKDSRAVVATAEEEFARVLKAAGADGNPVLEWALAARVASPRAALHTEAARTLIARAKGADVLLQADAFALRINAGGTAAELVGEPGGATTAYSLPGSSPPPEAVPTATDLLAPVCGDGVEVKTILYVDVSSEAWSRWHTALDESGDCYAFRHWRPSKSSKRDKPVALQGYSVHAAVKATEYKVVDDRVYARLFPDATQEDVDEFAKSAGESQLEVEDGELDMDAFEAPFVAYSAAFHVARAKNPLQALKSVAEDAPVVLGGISSNVEVSAAERRAADAFADSTQSATGGGDVLIVNGRVLRTSNAVTQSLTSTLKCLDAVRSASDDLRALRLDDNTIARLLHSGGEKDNSVRVDLDANDVVTWYNDLSKDRRYKDWDELGDGEKYAKAAKEPVFDFDSLVKTRANLLNLVLAVDPGDSRHLGYLGVPEQIVRGNIPIRIGVVLVPNDNLSRLMAAAFHYCRLEWGIKKAVLFLSQIQAVLEYMGAAFQHVPLNPQVVKIAFQQVAGGVNLANVLSEHQGVKDAIEKAEEWAKRMHLYSIPSEDEATATKNVAILATLNGIRLDDLVADILPAARAEQKRISENPQRVAENAASWVTDDNLVVVRRVSASRIAKNRPRDILEGGESAQRRVSVAQLRAFKHEFGKLEYTPVESTGEKHGLVTMWFASCNHQSTAHAEAVSTIQQLTNGVFTKQTGTRVGVLPEGGKLASFAALCATNPNGTAAIINGRILNFDGLDVGALEAEIADEFVSPASKAAARFKGETCPWRIVVTAASTVASVDSACKPAEGAKTNALDAILKAADASDIAGKLIVPPAQDVKEAIAKSPFTVVAVTDPLGREAPASAAFLAAVRDAFPDAFTALAIVPGVGARDSVPKALRVFRRFVLQPRVAFTQRGRSAPGARFNRLPQRRILTLDVRHPRAWFIAPSSVNYDLDNVILESLPPDVPALAAVYKLQALLVEGSCVNDRAQPPQGLQLALGASHTKERVDTTVMANLGYFQLRVPTPSAWSLSLRGSSADMYAVDSVDDRLSTFYGSAAAQSHTFKAAAGAFTVTVDSLDGACGTLLRVSRKPGMEGKKLIDDARSTITGTARKLMNRVLRTKPSLKEPVINVFSVASGHLYERFTKIMMLSVTNHASRPVKFWLLENYLSPGFKAFLPRFAKERGFDFEFVTYRWPGWLREQSEKQRVIWAYKILFLDVLFPLDVTRIIFVDADQVARADLAGLMDIDLQGAPYGYVPFCDSRPEVDGYRFWKEGFWAKTLGKQKYRISALYVVDLSRLRATAAGDTLRSMYHSLSADPNSLSNLDQDLPNYASAVPGSTGETVPIFDLPQDWLWCESWCSDNDKPNAKTIDLCNNPMTKEPKLESARRIIKEWPQLDEMAAKATEKIYREIVRGDGDEKESEQVKDEL